MNCSRFPENNMCVRESPLNETTQQSHQMFSCPAPLQISKSFNYRIQINTSSNVTLNHCGIPCNRHFFNSPDSRQFVRYWIFFWSVPCAISTLFTFLTFLIDTKRFQYPERPIVFLSVSYFMVALVYIIGFGLQDRVACTKPFLPPELTGISKQTMPALVTQGTKFEGCVVIFMFLYFFFMASNIWWVILTITWYLAAKCHWAHEAIASNSQYFHFAAWAIPAAKTIAILICGNVEGDVLSGVCFTGISNVVALRRFVIAPLAIYLLIGTSFLIAGFVSMFRIRTIIKIEGVVKTDKLEKLIMRIGLFSVLYIIPAVTVLAIYIYESKNHDRWMFTWYAGLCRVYRKHMTYQCHLIEQKLTDMPGGAASLPHPIFELFVLKYLSQLIVGITSGIWIWSTKTLDSWHHFFGRVCRRRRLRGSPTAASIALAAANEKSAMQSTNRAAGAMALLPSADFPPHHPLHQTQPSPGHLYQMGYVGAGMQGAGMSLTSGGQHLVQWSGAGTNVTYKNSSSNVV